MLICEYVRPGAYGRKTILKRDARYAYNHIVNLHMLQYLIRAIPLKPVLIEAAEEAYHSGSSMMAKSGAIRKIVPWEVIYQALWEKEEPSFLDRLRYFVDSWK